VFVGIGWASVVGTAVAVVEKDRVVIPTVGLIPISAVLQAGNKHAIKNKNGDGFVLMKPPFQIMRKKYIDGTTRKLVPKIQDEHLPTIDLLLFTRYSTNNDAAQYLFNGICIY
jgi:hypothetical protein